MEKQNFEEIVINEEELTRQIRAFVDECIKYFDELSKLIAYAEETNNE